MKQTVLFLDMFSSCPVEDREIWEGAEIRGAVIDPEERRVEATVWAPKYISGKVLRSQQKQIARQYGLHKLELNCTYEGYGYVKEQSIKKNKEVKKEIV